MFTWWSSQDWSSVKVKYIKNLEGFGLKWHTGGHRGGLWQSNCWHVDLQSVRVPNYWSILVCTWTVSSFYPKVWWLFASKKENCLHWFLVTSAFLHSLSLQMPLCLRLIFTTCIQETRSLGSLTLGKSPHAQGIPWGILWLGYLHLPGLSIALSMQQQKSFTDQSNLQSSFISSITMCV